MPETVADLPAPFYYSPVSETGIEEFQRIDPDLFWLRAHARDVLSGRGGPCHCVASAPV